MTICEVSQVKPGGFGYVSVAHRCIRTRPRQDPSVAEQLRRSSPSLWLALMPQIISNERLAGRGHKRISGGQCIRWAHQWWSGRTGGLDDNAPSRCNGSNSASPSHRSPCASYQDKPVRRDDERSATSCSRRSPARMLGHVGCFGGNTAARVTGSEAGSGASGRLASSRPERQASNRPLGPEGERSCVLLCAKIRRAQDGGWPQDEPRPQCRGQQDAAARHHNQGDQFGDGKDGNRDCPGSRTDCP